MDANAAREIDEAIGAADDAISALQDADEFLTSAGRWGVWDILGGGMLTTWIKQGKISQANESLEKARSALMRLQKEVSDIHLEGTMAVDLGFWSFMDYWDDGGISDFVVQHKINKGKRQVEESLDMVRRLRSCLVDMTHTRFQSKEGSR